MENEAASESVQGDKLPTNRLDVAFAILEKTMEDLKLLEKKKQKLKEDISKLSAVNQNWGSIIKLNVGGKAFATFKTTLTQHEDSMLARMFSGRHELPLDEDGSLASVFSLPPPI